MQTNFGSGIVWTERTDVTGAGIGPQQVGIVQSANVDIDFESKTAYGEYAFPQVLARGKGSIKGKVTFLQVLGQLWADIAFGQSAAVGQLGIAKDEADTVPTSTSVLSVVNAAEFVMDLGVKYAGTGLRLSRVPAGPTAGQYSVNASGAYTLASADEGTGLLISYQYTNSSAGKLITPSNPLMGTTPNFRLTLFQPVSPSPPNAGGQANPLALRLNYCMATKIGLPTKVDDFFTQEIDFEAGADAAGNIGYFSSVQ